tara:strand:- start:834 stop:1700 length:867 start_codon:yes stop_codon:yes gene_type:complete
MTIKIVSRSSKLALAQVQEFIDVFSIKEYKLINIKTRGDILSSQGEVLFDKANFVSDIEKSLIEEKADVAIHSAKDMPAEDTEYLNQLFFAKGEDRVVSDLLIFRKDTEPVFDINMKLGTSSLRRKMQAKFHLKAKNIMNLNGNIDTRIRKLNEGIYDCIILAEAGLSRLQYLLEDQNYIKLNHLTCSGQGALAAQWKNENKFSDMIISSDISSAAINLNDEINMEKSLLQKLNTNCNSAISLRAQNGLLKGEIFGSKSYISFSGGQIDEVYKDIEENRGLELLNEHH